MTKIIPFMLALMVFVVQSPVFGNVILEPTFDRKMAESDLVIIGTVETVGCDNDRGERTNATVRILHTLKGEATDSVFVSTIGSTEELNPRCCDVGATYIMFLRRSPPHGQLVSVWGRYGMVRIGGPPREFQTAPVEE